jgi:CubicO group peptidase (beta-lactamase class C family)
LHCPSWPLNGEVADGYQPVIDAFKKNFQDGKEIGASFTAFVGDEKVVELYGGFHDRQYKRKYTPETLQLVFSSSKVLEGVVISYLVDQGRLAYSDKIAAFWPEFAQGNKHDVTVAQLLGHRAGLTYLDKAPTLKDLQDLDSMAVLLASQPHNFNGTMVQGYHAVTRGWYLNELVRRVDVKGRSMGQLIREELNPMFDVEFYLGIPIEHEPRISPLHGVPVLRSIASIIPNPFRQTPMPKGLKGVLNWNSIPYKALFSQPRQIVPWPHSHNRKQIWRSESPSFSGITNSKTLATFAALMANNGSLSGVTLISESTVRSAHEAQPWMQDHVVERNVTFSTGGFGLDLTFPGSNTKWTGWGGIGGSMVFWNREKGLGFSYVMNSLSHNGIGDARSFKLMQAFEECAEKMKVE